MKKLWDGDTFTIDQAPGHTFKLIIKSDCDMDPPWDHSDGHGAVRRIHAYGRPRKRPGERVLYTNGRDCWLYDWQEACKEARRDGWNAEPYDAPNRIERAVQADFDYLRGYLRDDWWYVGVCVMLLDADGDPITGEYDHAVWRIESNRDEYIEETARDMALECAHSNGITLEQRREAWRGALKESRERRHWAARDVVTV